MNLGRELLADITAAQKQIVFKYRSVNHEDIEGAIGRAVVEYHALEDATEVRNRIGWLFTHAEWNLLHDLARHRREARCYERIPDSAAPYEPPAPERTVLLKQVIAAIEGVLTTRSRAALFLRAAGASTDEVADHVQMKRDTVRVKIHRGYERVRKVLRRSRDDS